MTAQKYPRVTGSLSYSHFEKFNFLCFSTTHTPLYATFLGNRAAFLLLLSHLFLLLCFPCLPCLPACLPACLPVLGFYLQYGTTRHDTTEHNLAPSTHSLPPSLLSSTLRLIASSSCIWFSVVMFLYFFKFPKRKKRRKKPRRKKDARHLSFFPPFPPPSLCFEILRTAIRIRGTVVMNVLVWCGVLGIEEKKPFPGQ